MPKISIVTPCYNCEDFLEETYKSVTNQIFQDWEWLLVDDVSTDSTYEKIKALALKDSRIKVFQNEKNSGASASRNEGLNHATGSYIAFLDADDLWREDKLEAQVSFMESSSVNFSFHNYDMIDTSGVYLKTVTAPEKVNLKLLEMFNPLFTSSVMIKRSEIGETRFKLELRRRQDYIFWYQVMRKTQSASNVGKILGSYRVGNQNSLSHNKFRAIAIQWQIYREQFEMNYFKAAKSLSAYALHGIKKYFL